MRQAAKLKAKKILEGKYWWAVLAILIYSALMSVGTIPLILVGSVVLMGLYRMLALANNSSRYDFVLYFKEFKDDLGSKIGISSLKFLYTFLWTLLFYIPGIVKSYSYSLAEMIKIKNPELSAKECISESCRLMKGNKMKLFLFDLSFIGWVILACLSFGIGFIFLEPYRIQARFEFINDNIYKFREEDVKVEE